MTNTIINNNKTKASLAIGLAATLFVFGVMLPVSNSQRVFAQDGYGGSASGSGEVVAVDDATLQCLESSDIECTAQQQQPEQQPEATTTTSEVAVEEPGHQTDQDLDCPDFFAKGLKNINVTQGDPYGLDADGDGVGCEVATATNGTVVQVDPTPAVEAQEEQPAPAANETTTTVVETQQQQPVNPYEPVIEQIVIAKAAIFNGDNADAINHLENALVLYDEVASTQAQPQQPAETIPVIEVIPVQEEPATTTNETAEQPASNESQQQQGIAVGEPTPGGDVQVLGDAIFADQLNFESCGVFADCIAQIINCGVTFVVGSAIQTADNPQQVIDAVQADPETVAVAMNDTGVTGEVAAVISDAIPNLVTNDTTPAEVTDDLAQIGQDHAEEINDVIIEDVGSS